VLAIATIRDRSAPKVAKRQRTKRELKKEKSGKKAQSHREQAGPVAVAARAREKEAETREEDQWQSGGGSSSSIMEETRRRKRR
jgi:hypothetical protein